jgi:Rad3-related DNA helicase
MSILDRHPAESWRPHQRQYSELVLAVAKMKGEARVGLEGPCGSGKSIGYLRALLADGTPRSTVLTTTRQHLKQLEETLERYWPGSPDWALLRGRDHYGCCSGSRRPNPEEDENPADVWVRPPGQGCPLGDGCLYKRAIIQAGAAQVVVMCTIGALYRRRFWNDLPDPGSEATEQQRELYLARRSILDRDVCVLDEAHEYLRVRREFETQRLAMHPAAWPTELQADMRSARQKWGGYQASHVILERDRGLGLRLETWLLGELQPAAIERALDVEQAHAKKNGRPFSREERGDSLKKQLQDRINLIQYHDATEGADPKMDPVVMLQWDGLSCKLVSEPLFANVKEKFAAREIFTSATLNDVAGLLKIDRKEWLHCFPPIFSADALEAAPLEDNADESAKNVPIGREELEGLYHSEGRPLTIVLYLSKKAAHDACSGIARCPGVYLQGAEGEDSLGELVSKVKARAAAGENPFLVCYGGWVGTDIPGDKWLVIAQAPKTPLAAYQEVREQRGMGKGWQDYEKTTLDRLQLAQGLGRALRTSEDRALVIWPNNRAFRDLGLCQHTATLK